MKVIDGWVKRESFSVKNKSACQEETGIGCNCLSESECMALEGASIQVEGPNGVFILYGVFPRQRAGRRSCIRGWITPRIPAAYVLVQRRILKNPGIKIVAHSVK